MRRGLVSTAGRVRLARSAARPSRPRLVATQSLRPGVPPRRAADIPGRTVPLTETHLFDLTLGTRAQRTLLGISLFGCGGARTFSKIPPNSQNLQGKKKKKGGLACTKIYTQLIFDIWGKRVAAEKRGRGARSARFFTSLFICLDVHFTSSVRSSSCPVPYCPLAANSCCSTQKKSSAKTAF